LLELQIDDLKGAAGEILNNMGTTP